MSSTTARLNISRANCKTEQNSPATTCQSQLFIQHKATHDSSINLASAELLFKFGVRGQDLDFPINVSVGRLCCPACTKQPMLPIDAFCKSAHEMQIPSRSRFHVLAQGAPSAEEVFASGRKGRRRRRTQRIARFSKHNCSDPVRSQDIFAQCPLETLAEQQKAAEEAVAKLKANSER